MQQTLLRPHGVLGASPVIPQKPKRRKLNLFRSGSGNAGLSSRLSVVRQFAASLALCSSPCRSKRFGLSVRSQGQQGYGTPEAAAGSYTTVEDPAEINMRNMVARRLQETARHFKRLGSLGFWSQFICTVVSGAILAFSIYVSGTATAPVTKYLTAAGIAVGFISVFLSFGYLRLSSRLEGAVGDPSKAPQRTEVVDKLKTGITVNVLGMSMTVVGLQATVGLLVAKALNSPAAPFLQGPAAGQTPVLALDVFLVQACANALLSHFLGLLFNLELLRSVTNKPPPQKVVVQAS